MTGSPAHRRLPRALRRRRTRSSRAPALRDVPRLAYDEVADQIQDYEKMSWRELNRQSPGIETRDLGGQEIVGIDMGLDL